MSAPAGRRKSVAGGKGAAGGGRPAAAAPREEEGFFDSMFVAMGFVSPRADPPPPRSRNNNNNNNNNNNKSAAADSDVSSDDGRAAASDVGVDVGAAGHAEASNMENGAAKRSRSELRAGDDQARRKSSPHVSNSGINNDDGDESQQQPPRRELNHRHREIKDVEIPRWVGWVSGIVPFVILVPMLALAILIMYKSPNSDPALWPVRRGFVISTILNFVINLMKRFFDLVDHIRGEDLRDAIENEQAGPDDLTGCAKHCNTFLCFMVRWKGVWAYAVPAVVYIVFAFLAAVFAAKIRQGVFSRPELATAAVTVAGIFILFVSVEGAYFVFKETERLDERRGGYIFVAIVFVFFAIFMGVVWGIK
jgi:hypothetical protein